MYKYKAEIMDVYDGDGVFHVKVDMGMNLFQRKEVRLFGYDAPELRGSQHDAGIIVRDCVKELILDKDVVLTTKYDKTGKYGRLLADVRVGNTDLGEYLFAKGYVKKYDGGKKDEWTLEEIDKIIFEDKEKKNK